MLPDERLCAAACAGCQLFPQRVGSRKLGDKGGKLLPAAALGERRRSGNGPLSLPQSECHCRTSEREVLDDLDHRCPMVQFAALRGVDTDVSVRDDLEHPPVLGSSGERHTVT